MDDHEAKRRCGMAAAVGGALGLAWLAMTKNASLDAVLSGAELGGLGIMVFGLPAGELAAWPLLWAAKVRPAWRVALLAPVPAVAMWHLLDRVWLDTGVRDGPLDALALLALTTGGDAAAALVTRSR